MDQSDYFITSYVVILLTLIAISTWSVGLVIYGNEQCVEAGYRDAQVSVDGTVYCEKRVDGTDVIKPLTEIRNN